MRCGLRPYLARAARSQIKQAFTLRIAGSAGGTIAWANVLETDPDEE